MTQDEANWRAKRTQQLLESGLERFDALAQVRQEAKTKPWTGEGKTAWPNNHNHNSQPPSAAQAAAHQSTRSPQRAKACPAGTEGGQKMQSMNRAQRRAMARAVMRGTKPIKGAGHIKMPINIRFTEHDETKLQLVPQTLLECFRTGSANEGDWHTIALRLNWGRLLAEDHFPDAAQDLEMAQKALCSVKDRHQRTGKWGTSQQEFAAMGQGLTVTDAIQKQCTRRELRDALEAVYGINDYKRRTEQIANSLDVAAQNTLSVAHI